MNNIIERLWNKNRMVQIEDLQGSLFQDESAGHTFKIYGIDDAGNSVSLSGTPSGIFHRPDNTDVTLSCSVSGGVVSATLPSTCYDVPGRGGITVFLTSDSQKTAIYAAVATVTRTESGTVAPPATQDVVDLINAISAAVATIPASYSDLMADIAPTYSSSSLYAMGQYAWYDGDLKRCIVPITTAESYTSAHWTSAVLGQDVFDLKSAMSEESIISQEGLYGENGYFTLNRPMCISGTNVYTDVNSATHWIVPIKPNDEIQLQATSSNATYYAILTKFDTPKNGEAPSFSGASGFTSRITLSAENSVTFTAPNDAAFLYLTYKVSGIDFTPYMVKVNGVDAKVSLNDKIETSITDVVNSTYHIPVTQFSPTRGATERMLLEDAKLLLTKCWFDDIKYQCRVYETEYKTGNESSNIYITDWTISRDVVISAINGATHKYIGFYFSLHEPNYGFDATLTYFGMQWQNTNDVLYNSFYVNSVKLTNYSESRLCTPIFETAKDKENISKLWLSDDSNYECILFANTNKSHNEGVPKTSWGTSYRETRIYILGINAQEYPYFYLFFRNKNNTSADIEPSELQYSLYNATDLQTAVDNVNKRVDYIIDQQGNEFEGKTFAVFCDSIGTHGNTGKWHNVPEIVVTQEDVDAELEMKAYVTYYDLHSPISHDTGLGPFVGLTIGGITLTDDDIGTEITFTPTASDVGKSLGNVFDWNGNELNVWWSVMADKLGMTPTPVCWASSSYSSHENTTQRLIAAHAWHPSQIRKAGVRIPGTMTREAPDYVILARGCNDMTHSPYDKLTSGFFDDVDWHFPDTDVVTGGFGLKEAISKTIEGIWDAYPNTKIILCTINYLGRIDYNNFPTNNDDTSYPQWNDAIRECADFFGCGLIDFSKDGITHSNLLTYVPDYVHPNGAGHLLMAKQAIKDIKLC